MATSYTWLKWFQIFFLWMLLTAVGWAIGIVVMEDVNLMIGILIFGLTLGICQALVLYNKSLGVGWEKGVGVWTLSSIIGSTVGWLMLALLNTAGLNFISVATGGVVFGISQWFVLRKKTHLSGLWILATMLGWLLALNVSKWPFWQGLGFGLVTGAFLVLLLARHQTTNSFQ